MEYNQTLEYQYKGKCPHCGKSSLSDENKVCPDCRVTVPQTPEGALSKALNVPDCATPAPGYAGEGRIPDSAGPEGEVGITGHRGHRGHRGLCGPDCTGPEHGCGTDCVPVRNPEGKPCLRITVGNEEVFLDPEGVQAGDVLCATGFQTYGFKRPYQEVPINPAPVSASSILEAAVATVAQRGVDYNNPSGERSMKATVEAFNAIRGTSLTVSDGWAFMVCLKMVRAKHSPGKTDSHLDGAAYFALQAEEDAKK